MTHPGCVRDDVRGVLAAERAEVVGRIAALRADLDRLIQDSVGANADDEHDPEGATIAFERAQLSSVLEAAERLVARPSATTCVTCASA